MDEIRRNGTTILMVTHDMGSIIKYCDKVVLLNKGSFVAEGSPGKMVDLYKKILANRLDDLGMDLDDDYEAEFKNRIIKNKSDSISDTADRTVDSSNEGEKRAGAAGTEENHKDVLMKDKLALNPHLTEYGDGRAKIYDLGILDEKGEVSNLILKGEEFTIKERIRFFDDIQMPIFTYTIKDKKGTELTGTNTMFEGCDIKPVKEGDSYEVEFKQRMTLQGGEYLLSMSCTGYENGKHTVYHRLYDVTGITVVSNKNTVGVYDMEPVVSLKLNKNRDIL
jgi:putative O-antigen ABC transporter, ATP-binding protein